MNKNVLSVVAGSVLLGLLSKHQTNNKGSKAFMTPISYGEKLDLDDLTIRYPDKKTVDRLQSWPKHKLGYFTISPNYNPCKNQEERNALIGEILTMIRENVVNVKGLSIRDSFGFEDFQYLRMFPELEMLDLGECSYLLFPDFWNNSTELEMKDLPQDLLDLKNLKRLGLSDCNLDSFPMGLLQMEQLEGLSLFNNDIKIIPNEISALKNLKHLNLGYCNLTNFPNGILSLSELAYLRLDYNNLKQIPNDICLLRNLELLRLRSTHINKLPESIGMLTNLKYLNIDIQRFDPYPNNITQLPSSFGNLTALEKLDIDIRNIHTSRQQIADWLQKGFPVAILNEFISFAKLNKPSSQLRRF